MDSQHVLKAYISPNFTCDSNVKVGRINIYLITAVFTDFYPRKITERSEDKTFGRLLCLEYYVPNTTEIDMCFYAYIHMQISVYMYLYSSVNLYLQ